jgi:hypothetical protein
MGARIEPSTGPIPGAAAQVVVAPTKEQSAIEAKCARWRGAPMPVEYRPRPRIRLHHPQPGQCSIVSAVRVGDCGRRAVLDHGRCHHLLGDAALSCLFPHEDQRLAVRNCSAIVAESAEAGLHFLGALRLYWQSNFYPMIRRIDPVHSAPAMLAVLNVPIDMWFAYV